MARRQNVLASLALAAVVALLGLALRSANGPVHASYDSLHRLAGDQSRALSNSPVAIVYLDLNSFALLRHDPARPWPREIHAQLLRKLAAAGAKAVVFDIVFSDPGAEINADEEFAKALHESGRAILAGESSGKISHKTSEDSAWARASKISPPLELFATNAAAWGIASHIMDDDYVVRKYLAGFESDKPSLTWAVATWLQLPVTTGREAMARANFRPIHYYGPPLSIPHVSYADALTGDGVPENFFRDKIVFIGARPMTELFKGRQDEFRSPFHSWGNKELFMPGVEVHATEMLNLIRGDRLDRVAGPTEFFLILLVAIAFGGGLVWLRPIPATVIALAGAMLALGLSVAGFSRGVWFPWLIVSAAQIPAALGGSVLFYSIEWYRARKRFEAAKRIADAKIREQAALIDKAHDAIFVQSLDGKILYANPSAERLYGWKLDELQRDGRAVEIIFPDAESAGVARAAAVKDGEWNGELQQQTRSGQTVTVASRWTLIRDDSGKPKALLLINSDITEKKLLEQQFLRTQRMNTIGTLAGGMAHDLNSALAPILMGAQLLRRRAGDEDTRQLLDMMETSTLRGADMVRQVLLFARGRGGEFDRLELGTPIKELEKLMRETFPKNIAVESFVPRDLWPVRGNLTQLHQVLLNLCVNARDAMPDGGKISFVADNVELGEAEAREILEGRPGKFVSLLVSDTGTGMTKEIREKIFEPFFTTKGEGRGTGIGLSTVLRIVKAHDGFLSVESEPGQGTSFEVFLPRAMEVAPVAATPKLLEIPRGNGELILVAEDEQAIRELISVELTSAGYRVLAATNGAEAVALFKERADEVRLFITDNSMPVMDGKQAMVELRRLRPSLPVIFISGEVEKSEGIAQLSKPFALEDLLGVVSELIHG